MKSINDNKFHELTQDEIKTVAGGGTTYQEAVIESTQPGNKPDVVYRIKIDF
ncbi:hypothetical protein KCM76_10650 [Zooshikella marina]|uniref:hypothetical protein n=1 Tax=Zooshikella ganghwensis TaxID=202772 RepID=UPI001BB01DA8|nr:hypothetical protein [Zooshikella ganghwensis]MBU2706449.1 hypothetical protein [Zooshikella ganghwensis]